MPSPHTASSEEYVETAFYLRLIHLLAKDCKPNFFADFHLAVLRAGECALNLSSALFALTFQKFRVTPYFGEIKGLGLVIKVTPYQ